MKREGGEGKFLQTGFGQSGAMGRMGDGRRRDKSFNLGPYFDAPASQAPKRLSHMEASPTWRLHFRGSCVVARLHVGILLKRAFCHSYRNVFSHACGESLIFEEIMMQGPWEQRYPHGLCSTLLEADASLGDHDALFKGSKFQMSVC